MALSKITADSIAANAVSATMIADGSITNAKLGSDIDASKLVAGTLPIDRIANAAVTAAKLHTTAVTDKLGYTPVNKAGDTLTGTLSSVGSHTQKVVTGGQQDSAVGGSYIKRVEEMINFQHPRATTRYFKVRVQERYASGPMGCALTMTLGKFSEHASTSHWRTYKIACGSGNGGDPVTWTMSWWIEKETAVGWNYYGTTFGFEIFYPSSGSVRDYFYIRLTGADNQGTTQSSHSFLHVDGFVGISDLPLLVDVGTNQPADWGNFTSLASSGTW